MTEVLSPITGSVWKIVVEVGAIMNEGETIVILESMKMEIRVKEGDSILEDDVIAIIEQ